MGQVARWALHAHLVSDLGLSSNLYLVRRHEPQNPSSAFDVEALLDLEQYLQ
jgi:hypothetical protein